MLVELLKIIYSPFSKKYKLIFKHISDENYFVTFVDTKYAKNIGMTKTVFKNCAPPFIEHKKEVENLLNYIRGATYIGNNHYLAENVLFRKIHKYLNFFKKN